jgi:hypothetical protein
VSYLEVDPQLLRQTGGRLRDAVGIAAQVADGNGALAHLAADAGHPRLTDTVHEFMSTWAHGLGCLVEDGETLASMLADSGAVYVEVEETIATAAAGLR